MAKTKTLFHSLPCGCQCFKVNGRTKWEFCPVAIDLQKKLVKRQIGDWDYSNHFKLNYE